MVFSARLLDSELPLCFPSGPKNVFKIKRISSPDCDLLDSDHLRPHLVDSSWDQPVLEPPLVFAPKRKEIAAIQLIFLT